MARARAFLYFRPALFAIAMVSWASCVSAETREDRLTALEQAVAAQAARIAELEAQLAGQINVGLTSAATDSPAKPVTDEQRENTIAKASDDTIVSGRGPDQLVTSTVASQRTSDVAGLTVAGDFRLRYETNWSNRTAPDRGRMALRARIGATYDVNDIFTVGARLVTGDGDDPNTADVTLSDFDDDLEVSFDRAYLAADLGAIKLAGGKIPQIFRTTDLLWDSDVNPQGASALMTLPVDGVSTIELRGLYFVIDENIFGDDSDMLGAQAAFITNPIADLEIVLAGGYYDYTLGSLGGADEGDFRGNLRAANGDYLSDFDIVDMLASVTWLGLDERWPVSLTTNYVRNVGAATKEDTGLGIYADIGRTNGQGDVHFGYSYLEADADAVLAAFSHDNIALSTDYLLHALSADYALSDNALTNLTLYHYRAQRSAASAGIDPDWLNRLRLNLVLSF